MVPARNGVVALVSESALDSQPLPLHIRSMHYSFREGVVSPAVWAWWAHASEVLSDWYGRQLNVERKGASLAAATRATLVKVAASFFGFGVLCLGRAPCLTLFRDECAMRDAGQNMPRFDACDPSQTSPFSTCFETRLLRATPPKTRPVSTLSPRPKHRRDRALSTPGSGARRGPKHAPFQRSRPV